MRYEAGAKNKGLMIIRETDLKILSEVNYEIGVRKGTLSTLLNAWAIETNDIVRREQAKQIDNLLEEIGNLTTRLNYRNSILGL